jgi:hypothetical protein
MLRSSRSASPTDARKPSCHDRHFPREPLDGFKKAILSRERELMLSRIADRFASAEANH